MTSQNTVDPAVMHEFQGEATCAAGERARILGKAIDRLPCRDRLILALRLEDRTLEDIGVLLDLSRERVRQLEEAAHAKLREILAGMGIHTLAEIL